MPEHSLYKEKLFFDGRYLVGKLVSANRRKLPRLPSLSFI